MSIEIVADKYGSAMFELAQEQNILELMEEQLIYVASVMAEQPELIQFNPKIKSLQVKLKLAGSIFGI
ncbi:MAG: F0F1 ATP synthase subunit delta [Veillonella parvula]